jgi:hypothetical protein
MQQNSLPGLIFGPDGVPLTLEALPASGEERWSMLRKGRVVAAVRSGLLALDEVCARYAMSVDEFAAWEIAYLRHGPSGLGAAGLREARKRRLGNAPRDRHRSKRIG